MRRSGRIRWRQHPSPKGTAGDERRSDHRARLAPRPARHDPQCATPAGSPRVAQQPTGGRCGVPRSRRSCARNAPRCSACRRRGPTRPTPSPRWATDSPGRREAADGRGEGCPLFYESERLELLDWRQEALSDRPDVSGSTSWGNLIPRIMVSARLRDRATTAEVLVINTHLDHLSPRSRVRSAEMIRDRVAGQTLPAIVMGDLNASRAFAAAPRAPSRRSAEGCLDRGIRAPHAAVGHVRQLPAAQGGPPRIDWIAVTPTVEVAAGRRSTRCDSSAAGRRTIFPCRRSCGFRAARARHEATRILRACADQRRASASRSPPTRRCVVHSSIGSAPRDR